MNTSAAQNQPTIVTNVVIFSLLHSSLSVLLVKRKNQPFQDIWSLPGAALKVGESIACCAQRALAEKAGVNDLYLEQLYTFGDPDRDPHHHTIAICYYALAPISQPVLKANFNHNFVNQFVVDDLPDLAFDHTKIIDFARDRLRSKLDYSTIAFQFLPEYFTLSELQAVYETIQGKLLDKRNFRKRILGIGHIQATDNMQRNGVHRPARLFKAKHPEQVNIIR